MAGPLPSNEALPRRLIRFSLGVTMVFGLTQLIGWPLAFLAPVFTFIILMEAEPLPVRQVLGIIITALTAFVGGFILSLVLLPYPAVLVLACCLLMYRFFIFALTSGAHLIATVCVLIGFILIPVVVKLLPELAIIAGAGIITSLITAIGVSWLTFLLIPAPPAPPDAHHHGPIKRSEAVSLANTMCLVAAPLLISFLLFGWTSILVLVYGVLMATALSSEETVKMGWKFVIANLLIGGVGMYIYYEALVASPSIIFMLLLMILFLIICGNRIFSTSPTAAYWFSGTIGFLLLIGGALPSDKVIPSVKALDRVTQIGIASIYVIFAYRVIDLAKSSFSKRKAS